MDLRCDGWLLVMDKKVGQGLEEIFPASETGPLQEEAYLLYNSEETSYLRGIRTLKQNIYVFRWARIYYLFKSSDVIDIYYWPRLFVLFLTELEPSQEYTCIQKKNNELPACSMGRCCG